MASDLVEEVLRTVLEEKSKKYRPINVIKNLDLELDLGNLLAVDNNLIDLKEYRSNSEEFLKNLARDNTQILINNIWKLPVERVEDVIVAKISAPTTILPREKPLPKERPPTKWEQYARTKGIQRRKKPKLIWDEELKEWKPRYGYRRVEKEDAKNWLIEVPHTADPYEDQFAKRSDEKTERIAKNEFQRMRNIARAKKVRIPDVGIAPTTDQTRGQVEKALTLAKSATASLGKFTKNVANEKPIKGQGKKRKFDPLLGDAQVEKKKNLSILESIASKKPKLDVNKAINHQISNEENQRRVEKSSDSKSGGGGRVHGGRKKAGKRPKGVRGNRGQSMGVKGHKKTGGARHGTKRRGRH